METYSILKLDNMVLENWNPWTVYWLYHIFHAFYCTHCNAVYPINNCNTQNTKHKTQNTKQQMLISRIFFKIVPTSFYSVWFKKIIYLFTIKKGLATLTPDTKWKNGHNIGTIIMMIMWGISLREGGIEYTNDTHAL